MAAAFVELLRWGEVNNDHIRATTTKRCPSVFFCSFHLDKTFFSWHTLPFFLFFFFSFSFLFPFLLPPSSLATPITLGDRANLLSFFHFFFFPLCVSSGGGAAALAAALVGLLRRGEVDNAAFGGGDRMRAT